MNKQMESIKREYEEKTASDELKARIHKAMKAEPEPLQRRAQWKTVIGLAASLAIAFTVSLNLSPVFAATIADIPGMNGVVKVLTLGRYVVDEGGFQADIATPKIEGLLDKALQDKLNAQFKDNANAIIAGFEADMKALKEDFPDEEVHMGVDSGYILRTDTKDYLAIDTYIVNVVGSSSTVHKFYTVNKHTNALVTLPSLFKEHADYITPISSYLKDEMKRQNAAGENQFWIEDEFSDPFEKIKEDQSFFMNETGQLVICFDKYEVGPGSSGCPEFVIPDSVLMDIWK